MQPARMADKSGPKEAKQQVQRSDINTTGNVPIMGGENQHEKSHAFMLRWGTAGLPRACEDDPQTRRRGGVQCQWDVGACRRRIIRGR